MKLLIAWADIHVVVCVVMEFLLAKESLPHRKATLRTSDVSFNAGSFTSSDILALVVAAVSDYFNLVGFQYFFGGRSRLGQWKRIPMSSRTTRLASRWISMLVSSKTRMRVRLGFAYCF